MLAPATILRFTNGRFSFLGKLKPDQVYTSYGMADDGIIEAVSFTVEVLLSDYTILVEFDNGDIIGATAEQDWLTSHYAVIDTDELEIGTNILRYDAIPQQVTTTKVVSTNLVEELGVVYKLNPTTAEQHYIILASGIVIKCNEDD